MLQTSYESIKDRLSGLTRINPTLHKKADYFVCDGDAIFSVRGNSIGNIFFREKENIFLKIKEFIQTVFQNRETVSIVFSRTHRDVIAGLIKILSIKTVDVRGKTLVLICNTGSPYRENDLRAADINQMVSTSMTVAKEMREHYFRISKPLSQERDKPIFGLKKLGMPTSSLGPFPEFVISTFPCEKTMKGFCIPCFFSKVEMSDAESKEVYGSFKKQIEYIIDNFDEYVIDYQCQTGYAREMIKEVTFCLACNGSIFSDAECQKEDRAYAFHRLLEEAKRRKLKTKVYLETCVSDYFEFMRSGECVELIECLRELGTTILFGFESADEFTREKIYIKSLNIHDFEVAYAFNERNGIGTGVFLYTGYHAMAENEIIIDFVKTLCYITDKNIIPVLMISNVQRYTIPYLLYKEGKYSIMDPLTAWTLFKLVIWFTRDKKCRGTYQWLTGDVYGGPPIPDINVFSNHRKVSCESCSDLIRETIQYVRRSLDYSRISQVDCALRRCTNSCRKRYSKHLDRTDRTRIVQALDSRVNDNIKYAKTNLSKYLFEEDMGLLKKQLLCYGVFIDEKTNAEIKEYNNIFGDEKNIHIAQIQLPDGTFVNANSQEIYCKKSPFVLRRIDSTWFICKSDQVVCEVKIQKIPTWALTNLSDGSPVLDTVIPHGNNVLALSRHRPCYFKQTGEGCKFCSSMPYSKTLSEEIRLLRLREAFCLAKASGIPYSIALSGGTSETPDRGISDFIKVIRVIKEIMPKAKISVEIAPPESNEYLDLLFNEGIDSITMNLEFYDQDVRRDICPGKSKISIERYFEAMQYSVQKLKRGNVSSVLIAGIEDVAMTCLGAHRLMDIGVLPTIIPFRPYDQCVMSKHPVTEVDCLLDIERDLEQYAMKSQFHYCKGAGCVGCNACIGVKIGGCME